MEVGLLGPLLVRSAGGEPVEVAGARQRSVLALLALQPGVPVRGERLIDELWPDTPPQDPANAVQVAVSKLRRALGDDAIATRPGGYELAVSVDAVDGFRAEALAERGRDHLRSGHPGPALAAFDEALALWRGDPLAEFADLPSAVAASARWHELHEGLQEDRFALLLEGGRAGELVGDLEAAVEAAPYRERLAGQLVVALYRSGRQAEALQAYERTRRRLVDDLGLDPGPELRALEVSVLGQDEALGSPAPGGDPPRRTNLTRTRTSLVGRAGDITAVTEALGGSRLVTLVGPGGAGKTRLARAVAEGFVADMDGGAWFISLEAATDRAAVVEATSGALGVPAADSGDRSDARLLEVLTMAPTLLVLDNCEQVVTEVAELADTWLGAAADLRILATSREALRVPGEVVRPVLPLGGDDAVALFVERARAVAPGFAGDQPEDDLVALCARLDGLPLAIELAAARMNAFTVAQVAAAIEGIGPEVTAAARTAAPRQRSLEAVTAWSHDLLGDGERAAFERLGVFAGPFRLEAALAVASTDAATLARLVDRSLVVADRGRFRLLFTLRAFARDRLAGRPEDEVATRARHGAHVRDLAATAAHDWRRPGGRAQGAWLDELQAQEDDLHAALDWATQRGDAETALRLAGDLGWYWWRSGQAGRGADRLSQALALAGDARAAARATAAAWRVWLSFDAGDVEEAAAHGDEALRLTERDATPVEQALVHVALAQVAWTSGDVAAALDHYDAGAALNRSQGDPWNLGIGACVAAMAGGLRGDLAEAEANVRESAERLAEVGDTAGRVTSLTLLAALQERRGDLDGAAAILAEARTMSAGRWFRAQAATTSIRLGALALLQGRPADAVGHYRDAFEVSQAVGVPRSVALASAGLAEAHRTLGDEVVARSWDEARARLVARHGEGITLPLAPFPG